MKSKRRRWRRSLSHLPRGVIAALIVGLAGCGGAPEKGRATVTVYVPCVIAGPMREVVSRYHAAHPGVEIKTETDKPLALLVGAKAGREGPAAIITMGDVEMRWLAEAGAVAAGEIRTIGRNKYPLVVVAGADGVSGVEGLADLVGPAVKSVYLEDPAQTSLGDRAQRAFEALGLWERIAPKVVRPDPKAVVLEAVIEDGAAVAVVFRDCLFAEGGSGEAIPRTLRIVGQIPDGAYPPVPYQAARLAGAPQFGAAREFVDFLAAPEGMQALAAVGLAGGEEG